MNTNDPGREPEPTDAAMFPRETETNTGWTIDYGFICRVSDRTRGLEYPVGMEETESVLLAAEAELSGARPMPDTPAPVCYAPTRVFGKFRTCELPSGHEGRHESHLGGETVWWENNGPECEHGHLARVCVHCELNQAEAQIAALETRNAELVAERDNLKGLVGRLERARMQPPIYPAKEAPDAE